MDTQVSFQFQHVSKTTGDTARPFPKESHLSRTGSSSPYNYSLVNGSTTWEGTSERTRRPGWDDKVTLNDGSKDKVTLYVFPAFVNEHNETVVLGIYTKHNGHAGDPPDDQGVWMATQHPGTDPEGRGN